VKVIVRNPLVLFFIAAYLLSWIIWGTSIAESQGLMGFHIPAPLVFWFGLTTAAYGTAALSGGWPAVRDLLSRLVRWRAGSFWYGGAILLTPAIAGGAIALHQLAGGAFNARSLSLSLDVLWFVLFYTFFFTMTEELAWRGFALPRLQARFGPLAASLILGLLWGCWHIPLWFVPESFQTFPFSGFLLSTVASSVIVTWIFNGTGGSVLIAGLYHASSNGAISFSKVMSSDSRLFWTFVALEVVTALGVIIASRLYRPWRRRIPDESAQ